MLTGEDFHPINLTDRDAVNRIFASDPPAISEYTFSNLFIWRRSRKTRLLFRPDGLFILMEDRSRTVLLPPAGCSDRRAAWADIAGLLKSDPALSAVIKIPETDLPFLRDLGLDAAEDRDHFDYLYAAEDLAELKGRKYDGKRWLIRKFGDNTDLICLPYDPEKHREGCLALTNAWTAKKKAEHPADADGFTEEQEAVRDYLEHLAAFHCCGMVLASPEGRVEAFTFGERLNPSTFVIHFEKANASYPGIYQALNRFFARHAAEKGFSFINREQDLGIGGIRKAKLSYHPIRFVKKYRSLLRPPEATAVEKMPV